MFTENSSIWNFSATAGLFISLMNLQQSLAKYLEPSKEIKQNGTGAENFDN